MLTNIDQDLLKLNCDTVAKKKGVLVLAVFLPLFSLNDDILNGF